MIRAKIINEPRRHHIHMEGHADYAEAGKDIICAAVSAYTYALLEYCETKQIRLQQEEIYPGFVFITSNDDRITEAIELVRCGLECLERQYPEYVRIGEEIKTKIEYDKNIENKL